MRIFTIKKHFFSIIILFAFLIGSSTHVVAQCPTITNTNQSFCDVQSPTVASLQATDNGGGIRWYATANSTTALSNATILANGEDYFADDATGTCGVRQSVTVTIYSAPTGANFQGVCVTSLTQATILNPQFSITGVGLKWYTVPFGGIAISNSTILNDNTIYYISQTNPDTGCETSRLSVFVNVGLVPVPTGDAVQEFCNDSGNPPTIADLVASGNNNWYLTSDFGIPLDPSTPLVNGQFYYATTVDPPCESDDRLEVLVNIYEPNDAGNDGSRSICSNQVTTTPLFNLYDLLGGTPDNTGVWSGPIVTTNGFQGTLDVSSMTEVGSPYIFTYTVSSALCVTDTSTVTITILPLPTASVTANPSTICENGTTTLTFTGTPNATVTYNINGGANQTITLNAAGTATIVVSPTATGTINIVSVASSGTPSCINPQTSSIPITVLPLPTASVTANPTTICQNGTTTLTFTGTPNATVTYNINGGTNQTITLNAAGTATIVVSPTTTGTINIVSVSSSGTPSCINPQTSSIPITVLPLPTASVTANPSTICQNGTTTLTFTGTPNATVTYNINGGTNQTITLNAAGTATIVVSPTTTGTINIVSVSSSGTPSCINPQTSSIPITVLPLPTASVTANPSTICENGTTTLTFTGTPNATVTYNINGGTNQTITLNAAGTATIVVSPTTTGTINIVSVSSSGTPSCINPQTSSIPITVLPLPTASVTANPSTICENGTTTLTFTGTPNATVTYNINGGTNQTITLNAAGTATIVVSPTATGTINIVSVASSGTPSCINPQTSSIPITVLPLPTASVTANPSTICENGTTTLTFTGTPNATVTYNINGGTNQTITLNAAGTATIVVSPTTTGTINIVSVSSSGTPSCTNPQTSSIPITVLPLPTASVTANPSTICQNGTTTLTFTGTPNATVTYNINGGTNQTITLNAAGTATIVVSPTATGTINIVSVSSSGTPSCINPQTSSIPITVLPLPTASVTANPSTICENGTTTLTFTGTPNATVTYNINGGTNQTITLNAAGTATIVVSPTATGTINIVSVASSGTPSCINPQTSSIPITVLPLPTASVTANPSTICQNGTTTLTFTGTPNATVTYNINGGTNQTITLNAAGTATIVVSPTATGTINIVSVASSGNPSCINPQTSSIPITVLPLPTASVTANPSAICENGTTTLTFTGTPNATVTYNINGGTNQTITLNASGTATIVVSPTTTGTINIVSVASSGNPSCINPQTSSIPITVLPLPTASVTANPSTICQNGTTTLTFTGTPNATVTYNINGGTNQTITLNAAGTATIVVSPTATGTINIVSVASSGTPSCTNPQTSSIPITVLPLPTASVTANPSTICQNGTTTLTFTGTPNATVTYNINGGTNQTITLNAAGTATIVVSPTATGTINIVSVASSGNPSCINPQTSSIPITVLPLPTASVTANPSTICQNGTTTLTFTGTPNATVTYNINGGTNQTITLNAAGTATIVVSPTTTGTINIVSVSSSGTPSCTNPQMSSIPITIVEAPVAGVAPQPQVLCVTSPSIDLFLLLGNTAQTGGTWSPVLASGTGIFNPAVDLSGSYAYTVTGNPLCPPAQVTVQVTVNPIPNAGNDVFSFNICSNQNPVDLFTLLGSNAQTGGTWSPTLVSGTGVLNPSVDTSTTYTYTVAGIAPCVDDFATVEVIITQGPEAGNSNSITVCQNSPIQDLFLSLGPNAQTGGTWSPALTSGTGVFNPALDLAGDYTYSLSGNDPCDNDEATITVIVNPVPDAGEDGTHTFCTNDTPQDLFDFLNGNPQTGGTWSPALASGTGVFNPLVDVATTYTYIVGGNLCDTDTANVIITVVQSPIAGDDGQLTTCADIINLDLTTGLDGTQGIGTWTDDDNTGALTGDIFNPSLVGVGTYTFTYTVTGGTSPCTTDTSVVTVTVNPLPNAGDFVATSPICTSVGTFDLNTLLTGQDLGGNWLDSTNTIIVNPINVSALTSGIYNYTYEVTNSCGDDEQLVQLEILPTPVVLTSNVTVTPICIGGNATVQFSGMQDGNYTINYSVSGVNNITTQSETITITGGLGSFNISSTSLSNIGTSTITFENITNTVTNCTATLTNSSAIIEVKPLLDILPNVITVANVCLGTDVTVVFTNATNFPDGTYQFNYTIPTGNPTTGNSGDVIITSGNGQFTIPASVFASVGSYALTVTGITSTTECSNPTVSSSVTFDVQATPNSGTFTGLISICPSTGVLDLNSLLENEDTGGEWKDITGQVVNSPLTIINFSPATYSYTYTVTNSCASVSTTVQFTILPNPQIASFNISINPNCLGIDTIVTLNGMVDGIYALSYDLSGSNTLAGQTATVTIAAGTGTFTIPSSNLTNIGTTVITITAILNTVSTCSNNVVNVSAQIQITPLSSIDSSNISISNVCIGDDLTVQITNATNLVDGVYQFSYSIPNANPTTGNSGDVTITAGNGQFTIPSTSFSTAGNYSLTIVGITTTSGCSNTTVTATTNFTIQPSLDITGATVSAQDTCVNFQSLVTISNANNLPDDSYTITYTLSGANAFTETITIPFVSGSAIFPLAQTNLTNAGSTTITITDIISSTVTCGLNGTTFPPYTFEVEQLGTPTLVQEGNLFCEDENPTIANLSANILNGQTVIWYTSETGGTAYAETDLLVHNTTYYAALVSQSGCEGATRLEVTVDLTICDDILIPDGFSPNNDTINDTFEIKNLPIVYPNFKLEIYNRYGNILYNGNKNTPLWDGTTTEKGLNVGGNVLPTGVYFYILYFNDGVKKPVQGRLYLSR